MIQRGERFSQEELHEMMSIAANSDSGDIFYEIYINHIMVIGLIFVLDTFLVL